MDGGRYFKAGPAADLSEDRLVRDPLVVKREDAGCNHDLFRVDA
jgi:hypothetical protein